jgi:hypothetical protein
MALAMISNQLEELEECKNNKTYPERLTPVIT